MSNTGYSCPCCSLFFRKEISFIQMRVLALCLLFFIIERPWGLFCLAGKRFRPWKQVQHSTKVSSKKRPQQPYNQYDKKTLLYKKRKCTPYSNSYLKAFNVPHHAKNKNCISFGRFYSYQELKPDKSYDTIGAFYVMKTAIYAALWVTIAWHNIPREPLRDIQRSWIHHYEKWPLRY